MKNLKIIPILIFVQCTFICDRQRPHPKACFTVNKSIANVGDTIVFNNCSDYDGVEKITEWHFGDTTLVYNDEIVQHIYKNAGVYDVFIIVYGQYSGSKNITIQ